MEPVETVSRQKATFEGSNLPFPPVCFAVRSRESLLLSISAVPQGCGHMGTSEQHGAPPPPPLPCPRPAHSNLESSAQPEAVGSTGPQRTAAVTHQSNTMKLFAFNMPVNTLCFFGAATDPHQKGCADLWLPHFLCKCSNSRRTQISKSVWCLVISCSICHVHFC